MLFAKITPSYSVLLYGGESRLALPVIRCLGQTTAEIHLAAEHKTPTRFSRYLTSFHKLASHEARRLEELQHLLQQHQFDVLIPIDEQATRFVIRHKDILAEAAALPPLAEEHTFEMVIRKDKLNAWLREKGFPYPKYQVLPKRMPGKIVSDIAFPLLLKPVWDGGGNATGRNVRLIANGEELFSCLASGSWQQTAFILQEYIPGYDIDCSLLCREGDILAYTIQKGFITGELQYAPGIELIQHPALLEQVRAIISAVKWSGIAHLDFRFDERDGTYKLIDFNARYWTTLLGSLVAGVNFADLACRAALEESFGVPEYHNCRFVLGQAALARLFRPQRPKQYYWKETGLYFSMLDPRPDMANGMATLGKKFSSSF